MVDARRICSLVVSVFRGRERSCFENVDRDVLGECQFMEPSSEQNIRLMSSEGVSVIIRLSALRSSTAYEDSDINQVLVRVGIQA